MECISESSINYFVDVSVASHATVPIGLAASSWLRFLFVLILSLTCQVKYAEVLRKVESNTFQVEGQIFMWLIRLRAKSKTHDVKYWTYLSKETTNNSREIRM